MTTATKPPNQMQRYAIERYRRIQGMLDRGATLQDIMRFEGVKLGVAYYLIKQVALYKERGWL